MRVAARVRQVCTLQLCLTWFSSHHLGTSQIVDTLFPMRYGGLVLCVERMSDSCHSMQVENLVVGAPCGVMDQMASSLGEEGALMAMSCQPAEVEPEVCMIISHMGKHLPHTSAHWKLLACLLHLAVMRLLPEPCRLPRYHLCPPLVL